MDHEPGTNEEIKTFATQVFKAEFPLFAKVEVNGENTCPVYQFLRNNSELYNPKRKEAREIPWNFAKFIVNREGKVASYHRSNVSPKELSSLIEDQLY
jgi:glutathione peroxidase